MKYSQGIESLRGILALVVFLTHAWSVFVRTAIGDEVTQTQVATGMASRLAVVFFFVVSGFVIASSIDANRQRHGYFRLGDYALARCFRIVPPLLAVIGITWLLSMALLVSGDIYVGWQSAERAVFVTYPLAQLEALVTLTLSGDLLGGGLNGPLWSLVFELRAYVIAGLLAAAFFGERAAIRCSAFVLAVIFTAYVLQIPQPMYRPRQSAMLVCFAIGVAAYALRRRFTLSFSLGIAALLVVAGALIPVHPERLDSDLNLSMQLVLATAFALLVIAVSQRQWLGGLQKLGAMSYTLYIAHFPILLAFHFVLFNKARALVLLPISWATALVAAAVTFAVCWWLAQRVERPQQQRAVVGRVLQVRAHRHIAEKPLGGV